MSKASGTGIIKLSRKDAVGREIGAIFAPGFGMNLISLTSNSYEVMDSNTIGIFEERCAGLGALIGPHFHRRKDKDIPPLPKEDLFPHIKGILASGVKDPFSHGIARYVPWKCTTKGNRLFASVDGSDLYKGVALKDIEGQDFRMSMEAHLKEDGLAIRLKVASEKPSVCGLHYYYRMPGKEKYMALTASNIKDQYRAPNGSMVNVPEKRKEIIYNEGRESSEIVTIPIKGSLDHSFFPAQNSSCMTIRNEDYIICIVQEDSENKVWQVFHPEGASYVCVEPISCQNPRSPESNESEVSVLISITSLPDPKFYISDSENG